MSAYSVSIFIERIYNLVNSEERKFLSPLGLQPVHLKVLRYLSTCNKYSNTPGALSAYLGNTKGTTSQTVNLLERRGYIKKTTNNKDSRMVNLTITSEGKTLIANAEEVSISNVLNLEEEKYLCELLKNILVRMQRYNGLKTFGVCKTCRFFTKSKGERKKFVCGLTGEVLELKEAEKICHEHEYV